ncbi:MAG: non-canonical purine NTP pyrophosphatase [Pirellulales bacterium]
MSVLPPIVLGTRNRKKGLELAELLGPLGIRFATLADFPEAIEVVESGQTFADNAGLKAVEQARHLSQWVLGEDSGLSVDALGDRSSLGRPGVYSARYAGENATDEQNNDKVLAELAGVPLEKRTAFYTCHMTLADPEGNVRLEAEDYCRGRIRFERSGSGGFGYDPLFEVVEYHRTFGELSAAVKSCLSHRARALRRFAAELEALLARGELFAADANRLQTKPSPATNR